LIIKFYLVELLIIQLGIISFVFYSCLHKKIFEQKLKVKTTDIFYH